MEAVEAQIRAWRGSPAEACRHLETCARVFAQRALLVEEMLSGLAPRPHPPREPAPAAERQWRWKRKGYVLFWWMTAALSLLALAAGYFAASGR